MRLTLDTTRIDHYRTFLRVKRLPRYRVEGQDVEFPDEYAAAIGLATSGPATADYRPSPFLFDY